MPTNEHSDFGTSDIFLAAALRSSGEKLEAVDRSNPGRAIFYFNRAPGLDSLTQSYWAHEMRVDPQLYSACLKELKARLYAEI